MLLLQSLRSYIDKVEGNGVHLAFLHINQAIAEVILQ